MIEKHKTHDAMYRVLKAWWDIYHEQGYPPSYHQVMVKIDLKSKSSIHKQITKAKKMGYVTCEKHKARTVVLTPAGKRWLTSRSDMEKLLGK